MTGRGAAPKTPAPALLVRDFCIRLKDEVAEPRSVPALMRRGVPLGRSQLYAVLRGDKLTPPSWDVVEAIIRAAKPDNTHDDVQSLVRAWRQHHETLVKNFELLRSAQSPGSDEPPKASASTDFSIGPELPLVGVWVHRGVFRNPLGRPRLTPPDSETWATGAPAPGAVDYWYFIKVGNLGASEVTIDNAWFDVDPPAYVRPGRTIHALPVVLPSGQRWEGWVHATEVANASNVERLGRVILHNNVIVESGPNQNCPTFGPLSCGGHSLVSRAVLELVLQQQFRDLGSVKIHR